MNVKAADSSGFVDVMAADSPPRLSVVAAVAADDELAAGAGFTQDDDELAKGAGVTQDDADHENTDGTTPDLRNLFFFGLGSFEHAVAMDSLKSSALKCSSQTTEYGEGFHNVIGAPAAVLDGSFLMAILHLRFCSGSRGKVYPPLWPQPGTTQLVGMV